MEPTARIQRLEKTVQRLEILVYGVIVIIGVPFLIFVAQRLWAWAVAV
jgi:hypothetical protein